MKTILLLSLLCPFILNSWTLSPQDDIQKAEWLLGTWESRTPRGNSYESWIKLNNNELSGKSYALKGKDTIVFETIRLVQQAEGLFYIPTVRNQNGSLPVRFALKSISETGFVFENQQHDFPQIIAYKKLGADSLVAEISGTKNGKEGKQTFPMKRI